MSYRRESLKDGCPISNLAPYSFFGRLGLEALRPHLTIVECLLLEEPSIAIRRQTPLRLR